ncbi:MAG: type II toxin-antitoxin system YafQ family toxin [Peptoniphilus harei]|nr:type II toxin-antitoxin system YafQ family toxin [Peptoniphilus harei]
MRFLNIFKQDFKKLKHNKNKLIKLADIIEKLSNGEILADRHRDHDLKGDFQGFRECYVEQDLLLIYKMFDEQLVLVLVRVGSHNDLF